MTFRCLFCKFRIEKGSEIDLFLVDAKFPAEVIAVRFYGFFREIEQRHYFLGGGPNGAQNTGRRRAAA